MALLFFKSYFPFLCNFLVPILQPQQIFSIPPIRRQHIFSFGDESKRDILIYIPVNLIVYFEFSEPTARDFTYRLYHVFQVFQIFYLHCTLGV